ncbi:riboflavin synthase [Haladaptatus sp. DJG-WS-42]|uniref:riboflavin synthase n=1 Tax=Haladaptatus sp. DJG-WS-42 TaxID=3120516 RepID=UPI0030D60B2B
MFTGIVETTGDVLAVTDTDGGRRLKLGVPFEDLHHGQSISVNGACLTVEEFGDGWFSVFLLRETLSRTAFDEVAEGDVVNVERAMPADGRFDGHIVQGHVDGTAEIQRIDQLGDDWEFEISLPEQSAKYVVEKGSITVDGISLTVASREDDSFTVAIIPTTYDLTNLSEKQVGGSVHLEVDVIAKYVEQLL